MILSICQVLLYFSNFYDSRIQRLSIARLITLALTLFAGTLAIYFLLFSFFHNSAPDLDKLFFTISIALLGIFISRVLIDILILKLNLQKKVLIVGATQESEKLYKLLKSPENKRKYKIIGVIDNNMDSYDKGSKINRVIGTMSDLYDIATKSKVDHIIITPLKRGEKNFDPDILLKLKFRGMNLIELPDFYELLTGKILVENLRPSWLIFSEGFNISWRTRAMKKISSNLLSLMLCIFMFPILIIIAIAIKLDSPGPVFYRQDRVGKNSKIFTLYKFRTMFIDAEKDNHPQWASDYDPRITRIGRILRKFRLDEIPQIINIFQGNMNFIGPRPERPYFVEKLKVQIPYYNLRLTIEPGITGWAAVKYGYGATIEDSIQKLQYDLYYIKNMSFTFDMVILFMTMRVALFGEGAR